MESPRRWATLYCFIYLLLPDICILSQNVPSELVLKQTFTPTPTNDKDLKRDFSNIASKPSSKAQFMNTLLSLVSNGALPDITGSAIPTPISENHFTPNIVGDIPRTVNIVPIQPQIPSYIKESVKFNGQSSTIPNPIPNMSYSASPIPTSYVPVRPIQTKVAPEPISLNSYLTVPQVIPLQNYGNIIQSPPTVWQIPQPISESYNYVPTKPVPFSEISPPPVNLQISPPSPILPEINTNCGIIEYLAAPNVGAVVQEPTNLINEYDTDGYPLNLQINLPSPSMPAPRITFVSATPQPVAETKKESEGLYPFLPFGGFPPPPPIIMRKSRSSWRKILPIILLALFTDRGCYYGGCNCCNCCSDSDNPTPIPFPIPIPINSPIINSSKSSCSSRKRGQRGNGGQTDTK